MGQKSYLLTAFILTIIETIFAAGAVAYLWWATTLVDKVEDVYNDTLNQTSIYYGPEQWDNDVGKGFFDFAKDWITAWAVVYTIFVVFYIIMIVLTYKYYDNVPDTPPQQPLRVIQPVTRIEPIRSGF